MLVREMPSYMQRLRNLREDHDMTQKQIAQILGTSQTMYARYERGGASFPSAICYALPLLSGFGRFCPGAGDAAFISDGGDSVERRREKISGKAFVRGIKNR